MTEVSMNVELRELEDSFEHAGATYQIWLHQPHDIWGDRIGGVVVATVTRMSPGRPVEFVDRSGGPHLYLSAQSFEEASQKLQKALKDGALVQGSRHAVRPDSPGDGA
jgi:hypothetical protein